MTWLPLALVSITLENGDWFSVMGNPLRWCKINTLIRYEMFVIDSRLGIHSKYYTHDLSFVVFCCGLLWFGTSLQWRHNGHDDISNHQPHHCLLNGLFRRRSKKTSKLHITGRCVGNSPVTGEFPTQMASNVANGFIWWHHHGQSKTMC